MNASLISYEEFMSLKIADYETIPYSVGLECPNGCSDAMGWAGKIESKLIGWCETPNGYMMIDECPVCFEKFRFHGGNNRKMQSGYLLGRFWIKMGLTKRKSNMKKPIVFLDLETTNISNDLNKVRIIEITATKVDADSLEVIDTFCTRCNNGDVPISQDAMDRHGILESDIIGLPTFQDIAQKVYDFIEGCDVGSYYGTKFDIPVLYYSFIRAGITWDYKKVKNFDIYYLYKKFNSSKLESVYKKYTGNDMINAHNSTADVNATLDVYKKMRELSEEFDDTDLNTFDNYLDMTGNFKIRTNEVGAKEIYLDFGKWKGTSVDKVDKSYFKWMMNSPDFSVDTRYYAEKIYNM